MADRQQPKEQQQQQQQQPKCEVDAEEVVHMYMTCHRCHRAKKFIEMKPVYNTKGQENGERITDMSKV